VRSLAGKFKELSKVMKMMGFKQSTRG